MPHRGPFLFLIALLVIGGIGTAVYRHRAFAIPFSPDQAQTVWQVEARVQFAGDGSAIDGFLNGVAMGVVPFFTRLAGKAQTGFIFTYAFWMVLGIVALVTWMSIGGGAQ